MMARSLCPMYGNVLVQGRRDPPRRERCLRSLDRAAKQANLTPQAASVQFKQTLDFGKYRSNRRVGDTLSPLKNQLNQRYVDEPNLTSKGTQYLTAQINHTKDPKIQDILNQNYENTVASVKKYLQKFTSKLEKMTPEARKIAEKQKAPA